MGVAVDAESHAACAYHDRVDIVRGREYGIGRAQAGVAGDVMLEDIVNIVIELLVVGRGVHAHNSEAYAVRHIVQRVSVGLYVFEVRHRV